MISPTSRSSKFPDAPVAAGAGTAIFTVKQAGMYHVIGRGPNKPTYGQTPQFPVIVLGEAPPETSINSTSTEADSSTEAPPKPTTSEQLPKTSDSSSFTSSPTPSSPVVSPSDSNLSPETTVATSANNPIQ
ncbi:hypothetical protein AAF712_014405 [Marasmius tenuissimus]|uniref:Uncharacterized protein n=1 Tax=Marasmius tenuissimus TaxID=585030 RepID=A0ABR2ZDB3_9AGAR